jgi:hypothetical protein
MQSHNDLTLPTVNPLRDLTVPLSVVQFSTESNSVARSGDGSESTADKGDTPGTRSAEPA